MCILKEEKDGFENSYNAHSKLELYEDYGVLRATDLKHRIAELVRIKSTPKILIINLALSFNFINYYFF